MILATFIVIVVLVVIVMVVALGYMASQAYEDSRQHIDHQAYEADRRMNDAVQSTLRQIFDETQQHNRP
jgi:ABC-type transporter Mla maintaining outer membrane lipid asymmetry permease subunit MlaE